MKNNQTKQPYPDSEFTVRVPFNLQHQAQQIAMQQGKTLSDLVRQAISAYVTAYSAQHRTAVQAVEPDEARQLMKTLGQGLGESAAPHDTARDHDKYLYGK